MNRLYYGDNKDIMREKMNKGSVDLIYLDPPFKSDTNYNLMYRTMTGKPVPEQVIAFSDTWELDAAKEEVARSMPILMREHGVPDYYVDFWRLWMNALRHSNKELLAYLIYMVERMLYMKSILKPTGSIYLHCDPSASHYIKVMMDAIFGHENFRNEIIWKRTTAHSSAKRYSPIHDTLLYYSAGKNPVWNTVRTSYEDEYLDRYYKYDDGDGRLYWRADITGAGLRTGDSGKPWKARDPSAIGRHWALPQKVVAGLVGNATLAAKMTTQERLDLLDAAGLIYWPKGGGMPQYKRFRESLQGKAVGDIWDDIQRINPVGSERLGYPTQKPRPLLERIIAASSNEGDVVFDPFCGCGTTIYAANALGRRWIGCDIAILSIKLIREVLAERYALAEGTHFDVRGIPVSVEQADMLFRENAFTFQTWFVERVGGFPLQKPGADRGVDGRLYYETHRGLGEMVLQVKGGAIRPTDVRDLIGTVTTAPNAELGGLLTLREPTKAMREAADAAGMFTYNGVQYPRIQMLTVKDVLEDDRGFLSPTRVGTKIATGQQVLPL